MNHQQLLPERKSAERIAFEHYIRTGQRLSLEGSAEIELKFNPYHDPRNGRFTFAPGGPRSLSDIIISDGHRGERRVFRTSTAAQRQDPSAPADPAPPDLLSDAVDRPDPRSGPIQLASSSSGRRGRRGDNGGPPLIEPSTIEQMFPSLRNSSGGALAAVADNIFDLTGPMNLATTAVMENHIKGVIQDIKALDPNSRIDSLGFPKTLEGQVNMLRQLRFDRAALVYRLKGDARLLQVEMVRLMQRSVDRAYDEGQTLFTAGQLQIRLSPEEAIGNYIDRRVRLDLKDNLDRRGINYSKGQQIRVIGREYNNSGTDRTYKIPDARAARIALDATLTRKTLSTPQIRGFFNSDFKPDMVIIIRPNQLGKDHTYAISRPRK